VRWQCSAKWEAPIATWWLTGNRPAALMVVTDTFAKWSASERTGSSEPMQYHTEIPFRRVAGSRAAQHDLDAELGVTATNESDELENAAVDGQF